MGFPKAAGRLPAALLLLLPLWVPGCALSPQPVSTRESLALARADLERLFAEGEPVHGSLGFYEATARALKHNLEHRVQWMQQSLAEQRVTGARLDLLPRLLANDNYYGRSNELASSSESFESGTESLEPSISSERHGRRTDLTLAWNLLDFGVSYVRASQEANRALAARERRAKAVQDLMVDVRRAYWRAAGAQVLLPEVDRLMVEVQAALDDSLALQDEGLMDPLEAMAYQRNLVERARDLGSMRRKLEVARIELASLVNLKPGDELRLSDTDPAAIEEPRLELDLEQLELMALATRPEMREGFYDERVARLEVRRAMLSVLPGLELRFGRNSDDNPFLVHDDWLSYSALLSKNLVEIVTAPNEIGTAKTGLRVAEARRLATGMAVLAQVHVARQDLAATGRALELSQRQRDVEGRSVEVTRDRVAGESESRLELIHREASALVAQMNFHLDHAAHQEAYGRMLASVGVLPALRDSDLGNLTAMTERIRESLEGWGRLPEATPPVAAGEAEAAGAP